MNMCFRAVSIRFFASFLACSTLFPPALSQNSQDVIARIRVEGNRRIESENVQAYLLVKPGDNFAPERLDLSLKTLFATGLFNDILMERDGNDLIVKVVENPIINQVLFEGNRAVRTSKLEEEVVAAPRAIFTRTRMQQDVQRILEVYRRSGRFAASVMPQYRALDQNRVDLIFEIDEGPKTGVRVIHFIGNKAFTDSRLRKEIVTRQSRWWRFFGTNDNYDPDRLEYDQELLRQFYANNGYAQFRIASAVAALGPDQRNFFVTFTIDEGKLFTFGKIDVEAPFEKLPQARLMRALQTRSGELYRANLIEESINALVVAAGSDGYASVDVRPDVRINSETRTVDITFVVDEGPRVYIERIDIRGNSITLDRVIRREILLNEGDSLNRILLDISRNRLRALRFFKNVEITELPASSDDRKVISVEVEETSTGSLSASVGFSSVDAFLVSFEIAQSNFGGRGQYLSAGIQASAFQSSINASFVEPRFMGRNLSFGINAFYVNSDYSSFTGYRNTSFGGGTRFNFPLGFRTGLGINYNWRNTNIMIGNFETSCNPDLFFRSTICDQIGDNVTSSVGYSIRLDRRNDPIAPTNGYHLSAGQDFAGLGGNVRYILNTFQATGYRQLLPGFVFSAHWDIGLITGWGGDNVRIGDRFFKGGYTFRGFNYAGLGPREVQYTTRTALAYQTDENGTIINDENGNLIPLVDENGVQIRNVVLGGDGEPLVDLVSGFALGGKTYFVGSLEMSLPLPFVPEESGIEAALFLEFGSISGLDAVDANRSSVTEFSRWGVEDSGKVRVSAGLSIFWDTQVGPLRFDFSNVLVKEEYDATNGFRFSIRRPF